MKLDKEDEKFLQEVKSKVDKLIDKICDKLMIDRSYFEFILEVYIKDSDFKIIRKETLINDLSKGYCIFCNKETYYFDSKRDQHVCAECLNKLEKKGEINEK